MSAYEIQTLGNYPEESIQQTIYITYNNFSFGNYHIFFWPVLYIVIIP